MPVRDRRQGSGAAHCPRRGNTAGDRCQCDEFKFRWVLCPCSHATRRTTNFECPSSDGNDVHRKLRCGGARVCVLGKMVALPPFFGAAKRRQYHRYCILLGYIITDCFMIHTRLCQSLKHTSSMSRLWFYLG